MVCRCSGLCFFSFFFSFYYYSCCCCCSFPLRRRRRRALFFSFISIIFSSFRRHISAAGSGYVLFIDVLHGAVSFVFFPYTRPALFPVFYALTTAAAAAARIILYKYAPRIIMCSKKTQPIRSCAESWNSTAAAVLFQLSFSTSHRSGFMRCRAVHGS